MSQKIQLVDHDNSARLCSRCLFSAANLNPSQTSTLQITQILEHFSEAFVAVDRDWRIIYVNKQSESVFGIPRPRLVGKEFWSVLPHFTHPQESQHYREQILSGKKQLTEIHDHGRDRWYEIHVDTNEDGYFIYLQDVTARKENELRLSYTASIVQYSSDAIIGITLDGVITNWNSGASKIYGFTAKEMIGTSVTSLIPEESVMVFYKNLKLITTKGISRHYEAKRLTKSGALIDVWITMSPIKNKLHKIIGASIIAHDITNRKLAEAAIRKSESHFRLLTEALPQIVWTATPTGKPEYYNAQWYEYTGFSVDQSLHQGAWQELLHPDDVKRCNRRWNQALREKKGYQMEFRFADAKHPGKYRWFLGKALPLVDTQGRIVRWLGTCTDIDERKRLDQRKDEFLSIASHELKTPITSIKAFAQLLGKVLEKKGDTSSLGFVQKMGKQLDRLTFLVQNLLDVTRISEGKLQLAQEEFDIASLISEVIEEVQPAIKTHTIIKRQIERATVVADKQRINQVITNLLMNAVKYSEGKDKVLVTVKRNHETVQIDVRDYGIGIAPDKQNHIFERFYRVTHDGDATISGLGLGLYISKEIINRHRGNIWVTSRPLKGSTFSFTLPLPK